MTELEAFRELEAQGVHMRGHPDGGGGVFYSPTLAGSRYYTVLLRKTAQDEGLPMPSSAFSSH